MKQKEDSRHSKAVALCEGQIVQCGSHFVRAITIAPDTDACYYCDMDSACDFEMRNLCAECDGYDLKLHILKLACKTPSFNN